MCNKERGMQPPCGRVLPRRKGVTLHLELPLATPLHSIHIGTEQQADASLCTVGARVLFLIPFSSLPFFFPHRPATSSYSLFCSTFTWQWQIVVHGEFAGSPLTNYSEHFGLLILRPCLLAVILVFEGSCDRGAAFNYPQSFGSGCVTWLTSPQASQGRALPMRSHIWHH